MSTSPPLIVGFKFLPKRFHDGFFASGNLKLGSLQGYRDTVAYDQARGDPGEGIRAVQRIVDQRIFDGHQVHNEPILRDLFKVNGRAKLELRDVGLQMNTSAADAYVFSASATFSAEIFKRWQHCDSETDACYVIGDFYGYCEAIMAATKDRIRAATLLPVTYAPQPVDYRELAATTPPAFIKSNKLDWQTEIRAVFNPHTLPLPEPSLIVDVPAARKFCLPFARVDGDRVICYSEGLEFYRATEERMRQRNAKP
jgi:hypothetical protein